MFAIAAAAIACAGPLAAFDRGNVLLENQISPQSIGSTTPSFELWQHIGLPYAVGVGSPLIYKSVPFTGPGHFLAPAPDEIVFHSDQTVSVWDGVNHLFTEPGKGYTDIIHDDAELGEIAPMAMGNFLVPERSTAPPRVPRVIRFNLQGRVAEYPLPEVFDPVTGRNSGADHIELLSDQCTLLYSAGTARVGRLDICTGSAKSDFVTLSAGDAAGAIRQLSGGDILVASGNAILQFTINGSPRRRYPFAGVTHIALSTDGTTFWAAGVDASVASLRHFDPAAAGTEGSSVPLGNPEMTSFVVPTNVDDLVVVGEWRAAAAAQQRRRLVRH